MHYVYGPPYMRTSNIIVLQTSRHICNVSSAHLNKAINGYIRNRCLNDARKLFDENPNSRDVVSWNSIVAGYIRSNQMSQAQDLFDQMPERDVVSWNTMLSGLHKVGDSEKVYMSFSQMVEDGHKLSEFTFSTVISAFIRTRFSFLLPQLHVLILHSGFNSGLYVGSALMRGYTDLRDSKALCRVFDEILNKDTTTWNALILGYMDFGLIGEAQRVFTMMSVKDVVSWTTLVNGYINNGRLEEARSVFNTMTERNVLSWTAMIKGYVKYGKYYYALDLFILMLNSGPYPNHFTFSIVLEACAGSSSLLIGSQVHSSILKSGIPLDVVLTTSLVDMYAKCGDIEAAYCIFYSMPTKNIVSWNAIIGGYSRHGLASRALEEFQKMTNGGVKPDQITFVNVLSACAHGGLVEEGERQFQSMEKKYGIQAKKEHYACMVDLFGKAGQLEKAEELIKEMPFQPDVVVWGALLGACGLHSSLELGNVAAEGLGRLEQDHPAIYLMLSKIHGDKGLWNTIIETRKMMMQRRSNKQNAVSWIESCNALQ